MALTTTGYEHKRLADVRADLETYTAAEVDGDVNTGSDSLLGQFIGLFALGLALVWELSAALYNAFNGQNAAGANLDNLVGLSGLTRRPATATSGPVTIEGEEGTIISVGRIVRSSVSGARFLIKETVTIGASGTVDAEVVAETKGATPIAAGELTVIVTKVSGWTTITNAADLTTGRAAESDPELRERWERSKQRATGGTDGALQAAIEDLDTVTSARVVSNRTSDVDAAGLPAKSYRAIIAPSSGHDEELLAETLWLKQPPGIESSGSVSYDLTDAYGYTQTLAWSYVTTLTLYVAVEITKGANYVGDDAVKAAIKAITDVLPVGEDVNPFVLQVACGKLAGVVGAIVKIGNAPSPTSTTVYAVAFDEQPTVGDNLSVVST